MKYKVVVKVIETYVIEIEAESMDEAKEIAEKRIEANDLKYQTRLVKQSVATRIAGPGKRKGE